MSPICGRYGFECYRWAVSQRKGARRDLGDTDRVGAADVLDGDESPPRRLMQINARSLSLRPSCPSVATSLALAAKYGKRTS